jgi:hypothetical protein
VTLWCSTVTPQPGWFHADYGETFKSISGIEAIVALGLDGDDVVADVLSLMGVLPPRDVTLLNDKLSALLWIIQSENCD